MWTKKERFEAVLNHELADRPPVSAWRHFTENEHSGADLFVETMLKWQNTYDWDYVKLQPRAPTMRRHGAVSSTTTTTRAFCPRW